MKEVYLTSLDQFNDELQLLFNKDYTDAMIHYRQEEDGGYLIIRQQNVLYYQLHFTGDPQIIEQVHGMINRVFIDIAQNQGDSETIRKRAKAIESSALLVVILAASIISYVGRCFFMFLRE